MAGCPQSAERLTWSREARLLRTPTYTQPLLCYLWQSGLETTAQRNTQPTARTSNQSRIATCLPPRTLFSKFPASPEDQFHRQKTHHQLVKRNSTFSVHRKPLITGPLAYPHLGQKIRARISLPHQPQIVWLSIGNRAE